MIIMKSPRSVDLEITTRCNLRCSYCSHFSSGGDVSEDLPKEEWLSFFDELGRCAVVDVCLSGGEGEGRNDYCYDETESSYSQIASLLICSLVR